MKIALSPLEKLRAAGKFLDVTFNKRPLTVSIEVTKRCNARCDFCDYWKISDRDEMTDFTDVIRWYQPFIYVKLCRAIGSRACEDLETDEEMKRFPKDSEGTAKIALIAMDRSISAWAGLRESLGQEADGILELLAKLTALRRETERVFPDARAFVRPGFDERYESAPLRESVRACFGA